MKTLQEYIEDQIWIHEYPVNNGSTNLYARMTVIKLSNGELLIHDPCKINKEITAELDELGAVKYIVAPSSDHYQFVSEFQVHYPYAETFLCPGLERKRPDIEFDWILGNRPDPRWADDLDTVLIQGTRYLWEVPFFHKPSKTLILVNLIENVGDDYPHKPSFLQKFRLKRIFNMWNQPKAAPEYQMGWGHKELVKEGLRKVLDWHPKHLIMAQGNLIEDDIENKLEQAWNTVLTP